MKIVTALIYWILLCAVAQAAPPQMGFVKTQVAGQLGGAAMDMVVWYPAQRDGTPELIGDNAAFVGLTVARDARPLPGAHPLVVISHGFGGNWQNQLWLAAELVNHGYIVAAPNHPGTTTTNHQPDQAAQLWRRPGDISRVIDQVLARPERYGVVAAGRIAVIGHSMGGWTALEDAGARFDPDRSARDCLARPELASCRVYQQIHAGDSGELRRRLSMDWRDRRVAAIVTLDAGLTRGFTPASLHAMRIPVLIIAAGAPSADLPAALESHALAKRLPPATTTYMEISDATHFSFMAQCKPDGAEIIDRAEPGEGIICRDGDPARSRREIHRQIAAVVNNFLARSLP